MISKIPRNGNRKLGDKSKYVRARVGSEKLFSSPLEFPFVGLGHCSKIGKVIFKLIPDILCVDLEIVIQKLDRNIFQVIYVSISRV